MKYIKTYKSYLREATNCFCLWFYEFLYSIIKKKEKLANICITALAVNHIVYGCAPPAAHPVYAPPPPHRKSPLVSSSSIPGPFFCSVDLARGLSLSLLQTCSMQSACKNRLPGCTIASKINVTPKCVYLPIW